MAKKICDMIVEFGEERGGITWRELLDYSMDNDVSRNLKCAIPAFSLARGGQTRETPGGPD